MLCVSTQPYGAPNQSRLVVRASALSVGVTIFGQSDPANRHAVTDLSIIEESYKQGDRFAID